MSGFTPKQIAEQKLKAFSIGAMGKTTKMSRYSSCLCLVKITVWRILDVYLGSRILIFTHPGSRIPDPKTLRKQKREVKKICYTFFVVTNFTKLNTYYVIFEMLKKKIWANFQRIVEVCTQKIFNRLSNIWVWDPGSGKNLFRIPDPGVKKAPDPGSRIRIRNSEK